MSIDSLVKNKMLRDCLKINALNDMQSILAPQIMESDLNMVVSAPTGSGKTVILELAIIRVMSKAMTPSSVKCVYMAPSKALCKQKHLEWSELFSQLNIMYVI